MLSWFKPLKKYATFTGRASREEYWKFYFVVSLVMTAIVALPMVVAPFDAYQLIMTPSVAFPLVKWISIALKLAEGFRHSTEINQFSVILTAIWYLITAIPMLAVGVRRLHDRELSGGWIFIQLLPLVGQLVLLIFFCLPGTVGMNNYGAAPR
ncbi:MAG: uncharacterized membrane protein YhaH (DUF805 family) [Burkholderiaceae bacterium]|jgi:uncharacterized membrane protein YhaH (DUF805 family)